MRELGQVGVELQTVRQERTSASSRRRSSSANPECELLDVAPVVIHLGTHAASLGLEDLAQAPRLQVAAHVQLLLGARD
jgi:hypothetical protein